MSSSKVEWESVKIPKTLAERAGRIAERHGYTSLNEFVRDAVRERLEMLEKLERGIEHDSSL